MAIGEYGHQVKYVFETDADPQEHLQMLATQLSGAGEGGMGAEIAVRPGVVREIDASTYQLLKGFL